MILMKQLEAKKRCDEREKKREEMKNKVDRERERRMEQKRYLLFIDPNYFKKQRSSSSFLLT